MIFRPVIFILLLHAFSNAVTAQPYMDIISIRNLNSPDAGIVNRRQNSCTLNYFGIGLNIPVACKAINGIAVISPFYEQWNTSVPAATASLNEHHSLALSVAFIDTLLRHHWRLALIPAIRMKDLSEDGTSSVQLGVAGLAIFRKNKDLTLKLGCYFNKEYFGNFFIPLLGIEWYINQKDKLFGILPGNLVFEHRVNNKMYYGASFRAITNSYRDIYQKYFRVDDNQLGVYTDLYLTKNLVLNMEAGHSVYRRLIAGEKGLPGPSLAVNDNMHIKLGLSYRVRWVK